MCVYLISFFEIFEVENGSLYRIEHPVVNKFCITDVVNDSFIPGKGQENCIIAQFSVLSVHGFALADAGLDTQWS